MKEPKLRFVTLKAIEKLTKDLNLKSLDDYQDWEFIVGEPSDIEKYLDLYNLEEDDDNKFALMEIIVQATDDQESEMDFLKYIDIIKQMLIENFQLHEYTIFYWSLFDYKNLDDCFRVTPYMRNIWKKCNVG